MLAGVVLRFAVQVRRERVGWQYTLLAFQGRLPTGEAGLVHWLPPPRLLDDPGFRPDVLNFQQQLERVLAGL